jgi:hypothetical protein
MIINKTGQIVNPNSRITLNNNELKEKLLSLIN